MGKERTEIETDDVDGSSSTSKSESASATPSCFSSSCSWPSGRLLETREVGLRGTVDAAAVAGRASLVVKVVSLVGGVGDGTGTGAGGLTTPASV